MLAIDVSKHNGQIDWEKVKAAGCDVAIVRMGYGLGHVDPWYHRHIVGAEQAGLHTGIYWYSYALTPEQAAVEAVHVIRLLGTRRFGKFPVWFDLEDADGYKQCNGYHFTRANGTAIAQAFMRRLKNVGIPVGLYANKDWLTNYVDADALDCDIWLAHYTTQTDYQGKYVMWQYTEHGKLAGVDGKVDLNYVYQNYWEDDVQMKVYKHTTEMPEWARDTFVRLVKADVVKVDENGEIEVQECSVQPMVYLDRLCHGHVELLSEAVKQLSQ